MAGKKKQTETEPDTETPETEEERQEREAQEAEQAEREQEEAQKSDDNMDENVGDDEFDDLVEDDRQTTALAPALKEERIGRQLVRADDLDAKRREEARIRRQRTTPSPHGTRSRVTEQDEAYKRARTELSTTFRWIIESNDGKLDMLEELIDEVIEEQTRNYGDAMAAQRPAHMLPETIPNNADVPVYDERKARQARAAYLTRRERRSRAA